MGARAAVVLSLALSLLPFLGRTATPAYSSEEQILLAFKESVYNWDDVFMSRGMHGWSACNGTQCQSLCGWSGVRCDPFASESGEQVTSLELPCNDGSVRAIGKLLPALASLQYLQALDLTGCSFYGDLPPEWGHADAFPSLYRLSLNSNNLTGGLPDSWALDGAFPALVELHLANNRLGGSLPGSWAGSTSFPSVLVWNLANNKLTGRLPDSIGAMCTMTTLALHNNLFQGPLPPRWGSQECSNGTQALRELWLHANQLTGELPTEWGAKTAFPALQILSLGDNPFATSLPPAWGTQGGWQKLASLNISHAEMRGPLPEAWGQGMPSLRTLVLDGNSLEGSEGVPASWTSMAALSKVYLLPGNPSLCTQAPAGAAFLLCDYDDPFCRTSLQATNSAPGVCTGSIAPVGSSEGSSHVPAVAIAAPVVAGVVIAVAISAAVTMRRRSRQGQLQRGKRSDSKGSLPIGDDGGNSGGYPIAEYAFHAKDSMWGGRTGSDPSTIRIDKQCSGELMAPATAAPSSLRGAGQPALQASLDCSGSSCLPCVGKPPGNESLPSGTSSGGPSGPVRPQRPPTYRSQHTSGPSSLTSSAAMAPPSGGTPQIGDKASGSQGSRSLSGGLGCSSGTPSQVVGSGSGDGANGRENRRSFSNQREMEAYFSDWEIKPEEVEILKRPDGSLWELGAGGFGKVYKAKCGVQLVAVKVLTSFEELQSRAKELEFQHEIALLRACRDTNIVQFIGVCIGRPEGAMLITEYMEGGNLFTNIRLKKVSWYKRGKEIALDVARGLAFLHSRKVIHFDIKSANVLLTKKGLAKIADVGMSRIMTNDYITGAVGTLAWSAPEMLWGQKCTTKADIYALGIVLWEIATGEQPVRGQLRDICVPEECPNEVRDIILSCLEPNPAARPTAVQLVEWLQHAPAMPPTKPAPVTDGRCGSGSAEPGMPASTSAPLAPSAMDMAHAEHAERMRRQEEQLLQQEYLVDVLRLSEEQQHEVTASRSRTSEERMRQVQQRVQHQQEMAALQGRLAQVEAAAAEAQTRHAGELAGLQGRLAELEAVALASSQRPSLKGAMPQLGAGQPTVQPQQQLAPQAAPYPPEAATPATAPAIFGTQHMEVMARVQSLSMASPFAAMFAQQQQREGWESPNEEGSEDGREAPAPGVAHQVSDGRQRTASGLLPMQDWPPGGPGAMSRAGSQVPTSFPRQ